MTNDSELCYDKNGKAPNLDLQYYELYETGSFQVPLGNDSYFLYRPNGLSSLRSRHVLLCQVRKSLQCGRIF